MPIKLFLLLSIVFYIIYIVPKQIQYQLMYCIIWAYVFFTSFYAPEVKDHVYTSVFSIAPNSVVIPWTCDSSHSENVLEFTYLIYWLFPFKRRHGNGNSWVSLGHLLVRGACYPVAYVHLFSDKPGWFIFNSGKIYIT